MKYFNFLILVILINLTSVKIVLAAEEYLVKVRDITTYVYTSASSSSSVIETVSKDTILSLVSYTKSGYYYKVYSSEGEIGYIKSSNVVAFIDMESDLSNSTLACVTSLEDAGFKDSGYIPYLCFIKLQHPNWIFTAIDTGLDWEDSVTAESACTSKKTISYIYLSSANYDYYTTGTYDYVNDDCYNEYEDSSSPWYPASYSALEYHLDPRNFLSEDYLFQFENLLYDGSMYDVYEEIVEGIVDGSDVNDTIDNFSSSIVSAGEAKNVNPTFLAARIIQELGTGDSLKGLYSGKYTGYNGLYNFVNWSVTDSCATGDDGAVVCGLTYAASAGWTSVTAALEGAASLISSNYISNGQYTIYLQKFNVSPSFDGYTVYTHQYQTNIEAPSSEAWMTYASYKSSGELSNAFSFAIPVYDNMPELIEGDYSVDEETDDDVEEDDGLSKSSIKTIVTESGYTYDSSYISGFEVGTKVSSIISNVESIVGSDNVSIYDADSKKVTSGIIKTGYTIKITNSSGTTSLNIVVYGDTSGDGEITALDLLQVQKNIVGLYTFSGAYKEAADTSKDGDISALDLLQIQKNIVDLYTIEQ